METNLDMNVRYLGLYEIFVFDVYHKFNQCAK